MNQVRAELQKLKAAQRTCTMPMPNTTTATLCLGMASTHPSPSSSNELASILPKLIDAFERVLTLIGELERQAEVRESAAAAARLSGRYDLAETYRIAAKRLRMSALALNTEITAAFHENEANTAQPQLTR